MDRWWLQGFYSLNVSFQSVENLIFSCWKKCLFTNSAMAHFWWNEVLSISDHHCISRFAESYKWFVRYQWRIYRSLVNQIHIDEPILVSTTLSGSEKIALQILLSPVAWDILHSIYGKISQLLFTEYLAPMKCSQIEDSVICLDSYSVKYLVGLSDGTCSRSWRHEYICY